jgi:hypothetical protein
MAPSHRDVDFSVGEPRALLPHALYSRLDFQTLKNRGAYVGLVLSN